MGRGSRDGWAGYAPLGAAARWEAPDGRLRTGLLFPGAGAAAGSMVPVWVDRDGRLADPPLDPAQVAGRARLAEGAAVGTLAVALVAVCWLVRRALEARRMAAWDADWRRVRCSRDDH